MKVKCKLDLIGYDTHIEGTIEIDEEKLVGMRGYAPKNFIYGKALAWVDHIMNVDYELLDNEYGIDLPYFDEPYEIN